MAKRRIRTQFDEAYYLRFYSGRPGGAATARDVERLARYVLAYLDFLGVRVSSVLDAGCGVGMWKRALHRIDPRIVYVGIDPSRYLCDRFGWTQSSIVDFTTRRKFDLVVCQDVLQYLDDAEVRAAIDNMAWLCRGGLYLFVPTDEDFRLGALDLAGTDTRIHVRRADWYRRRLAPHFRSAGGGLFLPDGSAPVLLELEKGPG